jgi:class 3 adenylate cyclase
MNEFALELSALPLFHGVEETLLDRLTPDMHAVFLDGEYLVEQGQDRTFLYIVLEGNVEIRAGRTKETRVYIQSRTRGDIVGEQSFINDTHYSADVIARGDVRAARVPRALADDLIEDHCFCRNLLSAVSAKLSGATGQRYKIIAERQLLFSHFSSHVDRHVADALLTRGEDYGRPQYIEQAFIMFCDLREFTQRSSAMDEMEIAAELEPYFRTIVDSVHAASGIVDKFIGDAVMAVWGHPALNTVDANEVVSACVDMIRLSEQLTFGGHPMKIGIGLAMGRVFMGNVGNEEKRSFTVLGSPVNLASRYESANKLDDGIAFSISIGESVYTELDEKHQQLFEPRPNTEIKGAGPQTLYSATIE